MRWLIDPRLGYRTGRVRDAQPLAPEAVSRGRLLADLGVRVAEHDADVEVRILLTDEPVLGPIFGHEAALALHDDAVREDPIGGVLVDLFARSTLLALLRSLLTDATSRQGLAAVIAVRDSLVADLTRQGAVVELSSRRSTAPVSATSTVSPFRGKRFQPRTLNRLHLTGVAGEGGEQADERFTREPRSITHALARSHRS